MKSANIIVVSISLLALPACGPSAANHPSRVAAADGKSCDLAFEQAKADQENRANLEQAERSVKSYRAQGCRHGRLESPALDTTQNNKYAYAEKRFTEMLHNEAVVLRVFYQVSPEVSVLAVIVAKENKVTRADFQPIVARAAQSIPAGYSLKSAVVISNGIVGGGSFNADSHQVEVRYEKQDQEILQILLVEEMVDQLETQAIFTLHESKM